MLTGAFRSRFCSISEGMVCATPWMAKMKISISDFTHFSVKPHTADVDMTLSSPSSKELSFFVNRFSELKNAMQTDVAIIGAGIVGLATAYQLQNRYPKLRICVMDKEDEVSAHQTGNNSGVIHSGVYYKPGSYKARNCVEGRRMLVEFCQMHNVEHEVCGKIIVAPEKEEIPRLEGIYQRGIENGIENMRMVGKEEMNEIEPHARGVQAIYVGCTGIVDYKGVCLKLKDLIHEAGNEVKLNCEVLSITERASTKYMETTQGRIKAQYIINCAGLQCDLIAKKAGLDPGVQIVPFRGEYYELKSDAEYLVNNLIYPMPNPAFPFLGVHFTRMALGGIECGPNAVFAFKREGYDKLSLDFRDTLETLMFPGFWKMAKQHWRMGLDEYRRSLSKKAFVKGLQELVPEVREEHLKEAPSGVRAMALTPDGQIVDDFKIVEKKGEVHVLNAPSPAATSALSLGNEIVNFAERNFSLAKYEAA